MERRVVGGVLIVVVVVVVRWLVGSFKLVSSKGF